MVVDEVLGWCVDRGWGFESLDEVVGVRRLDRVRGVSGRDVVVLGWAGRFGVFTQLGLVGRFGVSSGSVSRSFGRWESLGWVSRVPGVSRVGVARLTGLGCGVVGHRRYSGSVTTGLMVHSLAIGDVASVWERSGWQVWTERDMADPVGTGRRLSELPWKAGARVRSQALFLDDDDSTVDTSADGEGWVLELPAGAAGPARSHRPDLVVSDGERVCAVEVELTSKSKARTLRIVDAYEASGFDRVVYVTADRNTKARLERTISQQPVNKMIVTTLDTPLPHPDL